MKNRHFWLALLLLMAMLLSACGSGAAPAEEAPGTDGNLAQAPAEEAAEELGEGLPDEPYEAVDYSLYPAPEGGYVGDVMPFVTEDNELELYYLYDTDHNGQGYHPIYKYSTDDLVGRPDVRPRPRPGHRLCDAGRRRALPPVLHRP